jgi:hypothetical protein
MTRRHGRPSWSERTAQRLNLRAGIDLIKVAQELPKEKPTA